VCTSYQRVYPTQIKIACDDLQDRVSTLDTACLFSVSLLGDRLQTGTCEVLLFALTLQHIHSLHMSS
jgi:hypothetical protein